MIAPGMSNNTPKLKYGQRGLALLIFAILISLVSITVFLKSMSVNELKANEKLASALALMKAKEALLAYAVTHVDYSLGDFGRLPCPDLDDNFAEGGSHGNCGSLGMSEIGLFPWASLETGLLQSGSGSCLWYAVSADYKNGSPKSKMLNEDSKGLFRLFNADGITYIGSLPSDRIVALIFDPTQPVDSQSRNNNDASLCGLDYDASHFLEGDGNKNNAVLKGVADAVDDFIRADATSEKKSIPFNDRVEVITRDELWNAIQNRKDFISNADSKMRTLTEALAMCIAAYGNNAANRRLPRPVAVDFAGGDYRNDAEYDDTASSTYLGRYPRTVDSSDSALDVNAPVPAESILFDKGFCGALTLASGITVDLETSSGLEYSTLWKNWKDHFFYAVSDYYAPTNSSIGVPPNCASANCITVGGVKYAAVVMYSNSRIAAQTRNAPISGDADTKKYLANYIEVVDPAGTGSGNYTPTGNDILYCVNDTDPLTVVSCP